MSLRDLEWSSQEKKIARSAFDAALEKALAETLAEFKRKAEAAATPSDMWAIEDFLRQRRKQIEATFDFRYSKILLVFARLIRDGGLDETRLAGLSEDKLKIIRSCLSFAGRD